MVDEEVAGVEEEGTQEKLHCGPEKARREDVETAQEEGEDDEDLRFLEKMHGHVDGVEVAQDRPHNVY